MSDKSAIEWTDATWNPVTGCTQVSPGCNHCYALTFAERFRGVPNHPYEQGFDLKLHPDRLDLPLKWRKPRRIFVNSMSDLFHKDIPEEYIAQAFETMNKAQHHIFQVLTKKRPSRAALMAHKIRWTSNIWIGTSIENDQYTWRADKLRQISAYVRFISAEPLLGPLENLNLEGIHWLISGGESGPGYRPCDPKWVRSLRDRLCQVVQCMSRHRAVDPGSIIRDYQVLRSPIISILEADEIFFIEDADIEASLIVQLEDGWCIFNYEHELGLAVSLQVAGKALLILHAKLVLGIGAKFAIIGRVQKKEVFCLGWVNLEKGLEVHIFNYGIAQVIIQFR